MVALAALVGFAVVVAHPAQAAAGRCQDIPGVWSWFDGHTVTLSRDGALAATNLGNYLMEGDTPR
ncbi:MAG: hypothetical protein L6R19_07755 [Alphaproteobacteria bacterium]|nr:hypothetical protein [Alphaproteobacteria bacterium]